MRLADADRRAMLRRWSQPPSPAEMQRLERAERMVRSAVAAHPAFADVDISVEAKGSYANNTNVRHDSDVDIKVELHDPYVHAFEPKLNFMARQLRNDYQGPWTAGHLRDEVGTALAAAFDDVDAGHNVAFYVPEVAGSRPSTDVVPCYTFRQYQNTACTQWDEGSIVYTRDGGKIVNWPRQQLINGRDKNARTNHRYKFVVRALKAVENDLAGLGEIDALPSYLMECLTYNVPDQVLTGDTLDEAFCGAIAHLRGRLNAFWGDWREMREPNEMKRVFQDGQKWKVQDARQLLEAAWSHLAYGS